MSAVAAYEKRSVTASSMPYCLVALECGSIRAECNGEIETFHPVLAGRWRYPPGCVRLDWPLERQSGFRGGLLFAS